MFNAREARALAQRAAQGPAALLAAKTAVVQAAEQGKMQAIARFPQPLRLPTAGPNPSLSDAQRLLREQGKSEWADVATQCLAAGYSVTAVRDTGSAGQFVLAGLNLRWDSPRSPSPGSLVMSAETAYRMAQQADTLAQWAKPFLDAVERAAASGRSLHIDKDPMPAGDKGWTARLEHLRTLGFEVEVRAVGPRSELVFSW